MKKSLRSKVLTGLMALSLCLSMTACGGDEPESTTGQVPVNPLEAINFNEYHPESSTVVEPEESMLQKMVDAYNQNSDTVGWLKIDNTTIDDVVVQSTANNNYYLRLNAYTKAYDWYGCYYADCANTIGARSSLDKNTIIYGHSMSDNPDRFGDPDRDRFSQLKKYLDVEFAKENPYIHFTTPDDDMVFQIFSVMYCDSSWNYIEPNPGTQEFTDLINEAKMRSQINFDVQVSSTDKILTLSTCTYIYGMDNTTQRFVVMAKLLPAGTELQESVEATVNPNPKAPY